MTKTTIIQHPEQGRVEGVTYKKIELLDAEARAIFHGDCAVEGWISQDKGCLYLKAGGWEEVPPKRDVTGKVEIIQDEQDMKLVVNDEVYCIPKGFEARKSQAVVLPEGMSWGDFWFKFWADKRSDDSPEHVCERMASTVIQVWQEVK